MTSLMDLSWSLFNAHSECLPCFQPSGQTACIAHKNLHDLVSAFLGDFSTLLLIILCALAISACLCQLEQLKQIISYFIFNAFVLSTPLDFHPIHLSEPPYLARWLFPFWLDGFFFLDGFPEYSLCYLILAP